MIKNIIWDFDGVILDSESLHNRAWIQVLQKLVPDKINDENLKILETFAGRAGHYNASVLKRTFLIEDSEETIHLQKREIFQHMINATYINQDALALMRKNTANGGKNYLASSSSLALPFCQKHGIKFDGIVSYNEVTSTKPSPAIFIQCFEKFSLNPTETLIIEDSRNGLLACENLQKHYPVRYLNYKNKKEANPIFDLVKVSLT